MNITRKAAHKPPRVLLYGSAGLGKTSFVAGALDPIIIQTEEGADEIDVPRFDLCRTLDEVLQQIGWLATEEHEFKTLGIDSLDWLERLVWAETCRANGWKSMDEVPYGRSYAAAIDYWKLLLDDLTALRDERGMSVVLLAHHEIRRFDAPDTEGYDRFQPKLHKAAAALVIEFCDAVLFLNWRVTVLKSDAGFKKTVTRGVGGAQRIVHSEEKPAFKAKNRYGMPDAIEMPNDPGLMWSAVAQHIPFYAHLFVEPTPTAEKDVAA